MSADNWSKCPKCKETLEKSRARLIEKARESYGTVSIEKYNDMVKKATQPTELDVTLREDYEFDLEDEILTVDYGCSCSVCGLQFGYKKELNILSPKQA